MPRSPCHDFQPGRLALELGDVEERLPHSIAVGPGRRPRRFAVDEQIDARLARMVAAADPEADVPPLDRERFAGQRSGAAVLGLTSSPGAEACELTTRRTPGRRHRPGKQECWSSGSAPYRRRRPSLSSLRRSPSGSPRTCVRSLGLLRRIGSDLAFKNRQPELIRNVPVPTLGCIARRSVQPDGVFQPAGQLHFDLGAARILDRVAHHGGGQARRLRVEGDVRREGLERHGDGRLRIAIIDVSDRDTRRRS